MNDNRANGMIETSVQREFVESKTVEKTVLTAKKDVDVVSNGIDAKTETTESCVEAEEYVKIPIQQLIKTFEKQTRLFINQTEFSKGKINEELLITKQKNVEEKRLPFEVEESADGAAKAPGNTPSYQTFADFERQTMQSQEPLIDDDKWPTPNGFDDFDSRSNAANNTFEPIDDTLELNRYEGKTN